MNKKNVKQILKQHSVLLQLIEPSNVLFKGTVRVITLHTQLLMPDVHAMPLKSLSDQVLNRYPCFCFFKLLFSFAGYLSK